ncbi:MAG: Ig-like domain-containing protein [Muribaculaceae bacterium]
MRKIFLYISFLLIFLSIVSCGKFEVLYFDISTKEAVMHVSETLQIKAAISYSGDGNTDMHWSSSAPEIASVDSMGMVSALRNGVATITLECASQTATCEITVEPQTFILYAIVSSSYSGFSLVCNDEIVASSSTKSTPHRLHIEKSDNYIAGTYFKEVTTSGDEDHEPTVTTTLHAAYWKNGSMKQLDESELNSEALAIAVMNDTTYTAGYITDGTSSKGVIWKAAVATEFQEFSEITDIKASGNMIIACGNNDDNAMIYIDGIITVLEGDNCHASQLAIIGDDIYIAGYTIVNGKKKATIWKGSSVLFISDNESEFTAISEYEGSPIACGNSIGYEVSNIFIYSNGTIGELTNYSSKLYATGIGTIDNYAAACGYEKIDDSDSTLFNPFIYTNGTFSPLNNIDAIPIDMYTR